MNETIEQHFPISIARKIIVSDDEAVDVLLVIFANDSFDVLRARQRLLRPCTLMMVQNEHW